MWDANGEHMTKDDNVMDELLLTTLGLTTQKLNDVTISDSCEVMRKCDVDATSLSKHGLNPQN